jgi:hypothetical protein
MMKSKPREPSKQATIGPEPSRNSEDEGEAKPPDLGEKSKQTGRLLSAARWSRDYKRKSVFRLQSPGNRL